MPRDLNVVIITAHCSNSRCRIGIRLEEKSRKHWIADWAFKIKDSAARREGYDKTRVDGQFEFSPEFPGCPYCNAKWFVLCDCKTLLCNDLNSSVFKCPVCGVSGSVGSDPVTSLSAGQDS